MDFQTQFNFQPSEQQVEAYKELTAVMSQFTEADLIWLKLKDVSDRWTVDSLRRNTRRLLAFQRAGLSPFPTLLRGAVVVVVDSIDYLTFAAIQAAGCEIKAATTTAENPAAIEPAELNIGGVAIESYLPEMEDEVPHVFLTDNDGCMIYEVMTVPTLAIKHLVTYLDDKTDEEKAEFLGAYSDSRVEGCMVYIQPWDSESAVYAEAVFDLKSLVITTTREFQVRGGSFIHKVGHVSGSTNMTLLALQLAGTQMASQVEVDGTLAFLTQLWEEEDNYGRQMDKNDQLRMVRANTYSILKAVGTWDLPLFRLENFNNKLGVAEAIKYFSSLGIEWFADKYCLKRIVIGAGVEALLVGFDKSGEAAVLITDVNEKKLLNRPWNGVAIAASEGLPGTPGYRAYRASKMHIKTSQGNVRVFGDPTEMVFTNCRILNNGSGVADTNRMFSYSLEKSLRGQFNALNLRPNQTLEEAKAEIEMQLQKLCDTNLILRNTDHNGYKSLLRYNGVDILVFRGMNQDICIGKIGGAYPFKVRQLSTSNSLSIELSVRMFASDYEMKTRGLGIKAVCKKTGTRVLDNKGVNVPYEVHMGVETQKGYAWVLPIFCEAMAPKEDDFCLIDVSKGCVTLPDGEVVDLSDPESKFVKWAQKNTEEFTVEGTICKDEFEFLLSGHEDNSDIEVVEDKGDYLVVHEKVTGIRGTYVVQIEVSTPRENTGKQAATMEQLAGIAVTCPDLARVLIQ